MLPKQVIQLRRFSHPVQLCGCDGRALHGMWHHGASLPELDESGRCSQQLQTLVFITPRNRCGLQSRRSKRKHDCRLTSECMKVFFPASKGYDARLCIGTAVTGLGRLWRCTWRCRPWWRPHARRRHHWHHIHVRHATSYHTRRLHHSQRRHHARLRQ
jgi:hypothetical protein